ncbi:MAG TPA: L,D-transpeptidase family protein [Xanthobacteraceae bacterium]|jgi:murein L,D-transpeptidase YcbB/YkuD|nr:L,D-transpeptidase family protein [Xanthobacteraceae bacterium]
MPGIRVDRLLVSTAVALLCCASAALADPASPAGDKPVSAAPAVTTPAPAQDGAAAAAAPASQNSKDAVSKNADGSPAAAGSSPSPDTAAVPAAPGASAETKPATPAATAPAATAATPAASSPETATAPAAPPPGPDDAIADQLRGLGTGKFDHLITNKKDRTQIDAFYSGRNYKPLWITDGKPNARATATIAYLGHVDADGLFPSDYPVPKFDAAATPADLANAEMQLTASVITYAHHASIGRVAYSRVSPDIEFDRPAPEAADVLATVAGAKDLAAALDSYEPKTPGYLALKAKLAEIRGGKIDKGQARLAGGPMLKVGMQDDRVPDLRQRLHVLGDGGTTYDKALAEAVKKFQKEHELPATGTLTAATIDALNGPKLDHVEDTIIANMERWRWMPHQFPDTYVIVNLPDYSLRVMHDGKEMWKTKIVIGKPDTVTPIMTAEMKFITVNPTWNVPPSIINHEYLPALAQDPTVLDRMGLKIARNPDGSVHIWQPPGDANALGRIRFNFPNKFLVYQHDTPDKYLFASAKRAYSHGCMRVQDPVHYAEVLLSLVRPNDGYTEERIKKMYGPNEVNIEFPTFVPVNLSYQTAFVDSEGKLEFRDDIYGRDKALIAILKGDRKDADIPVEHKEDISHREVLAMPDQPSLFGHGGLFGGANYYPDGRSAPSGGENFFTRLFGGFNAAPPPQQPVKRHAAAHPKKVSRAKENKETVER